MIDLRLECDNGWFEGVIGGEINGEAEQAALEGRVGWTEDHCLPLEKIIVTYGTRRAVSRGVAQDICIFAF